MPGQRCCPCFTVFLAPDAFNCSTISRSALARLLTEQAVHCFLIRLRTIRPWVLWPVPLLLAYLRAPRGDVIGQLYPQAPCIDGGQNSPLARGSFAPSSFWSGPWARGRSSALLSVSAPSLPVVGLVLRLGLPASLPLSSPSLWPSCSALLWLASGSDSSLLPAASAMALCFSLLGRACGLDKNALGGPLHGFFGFLCLVSARVLLRGGSSCLGQFLVCLASASFSLSVLRPSSFMYKLCGADGGPPPADHVCPTFTPSARGAVQGVRTRFVSSSPSSLRSPEIVPGFSGLFLIVALLFFSRTFFHHPPRDRALVPVFRPAVRWRDTAGLAVSRSARAGC